jgi:hypothetical protein
MRWLRDRRRMHENRCIPACNVHLVATALRKRDRAPTLETIVVSPPRATRRGSV